MPPSQFDVETALTPHGEGRWTTDLSASWNINDKSNGGYLLTPALRAMRELSGHSDPLTVTTHFFRPGRGGSGAEVTAELLKLGRTITTATGQVSQDGKPRLSVMAGFGDLPPPTEWQGDDSADLTIAMPDMPGPEECVDRSSLNQGIHVVLNSRAEILTVPEQPDPKQTGRSEMLGWVRFRDRRDPCTLSLPFFCDAFPPSVFTMLGAVGWVPTIELTVHIRRRPAPGWLAAHFWCDDLAAGKVIESGRLWDSTGALVAQSRQLGLLL